MFADVNNSAVSLPLTVGLGALEWESRKTIERSAEARLPTRYGDFRIIGYRSLVSDEDFVVLTRGTFKSGVPALARIHSQCVTGDVFGSIKCDCGQPVSYTHLTLPTTPYV